MPVGTHPHLLVVGVGNPIAVRGLARLGARRGEMQGLQSADQQQSGSLTAEGFSKYCFYTGVMISRSASPMFLFSALYSSDTTWSMGRTCVCCVFGRRGGYWRI
jgi:hypothetical protein